VEGEAKNKQKKGCIEKTKSENKKTDADIGVEKSDQIEKEKKERELRVKERLKSGRGVILLFPRDESLREPSPHDRCSNGAENKASSQVQGGEFRF